MGSVFTWSGWVRFDRSAVDAFCRPISRKTVWNQTDGWELELTSGNDTRLTTHGGGSASVYALNFVPSWSNHAWYYVTVVYSNAVVQMYRDGVSQTVGGSLNPVVDNSLGLTFGNDVDHNEAKWQGVFDEYRIRTGAASADRIWAEYMNMASNGVFQTYSDSPRGTFFLLR